MKLWAEGLGWACGEPDGMSWEGTRAHPGAVRGGWTEVQWAREARSPCPNACEDWMSGQEFGRQEGAAGGGALLTRHSGKRSGALGWRHRSCSVCGQQPKPRALARAKNKCEGRQERAQGNLGLWGHNGETEAREVGVG